MTNKRKMSIWLLALVFAVLLCGAASAAAPKHSDTGKTVSASGSQVSMTVYSITPVTAKGQKFYVENSAKNLGNTTSKAFFAKYYLVPTKTLLKSKIYLGQQFFPSMLRGNYDKVVSQFTVPYNMAAGSYYVAAVIDKTQIGFSTTKTLVWPKEIDSGTTNVPTYGKFTWNTFTTSTNDVLSYSQFYNPNIGHFMKQKTTLAKYTGTGGFNMYMYIVPKITGTDNYWTGFETAFNAVQYYWHVFRPDMIQNGPSH